LGFLEKSCEITSIHLLPEKTRRIALNLNTAARKK